MALQDPWNGGPILPKRLLLIGKWQSRDKYYHFHARLDFFHHYWNYLCDQYANYTSLEHVKCQGKRETSSTSGRIISCMPRVQRAI
ncbi:hypothetical protein MMC16_002060 [Acarospora aff. strigata]|nr:hypothetical protein [Acarospora aff. strigata]